MIIENVFDGILYGLTPKESVWDETILINGDDAVKLLMIFEASSLNTDSTTISVSKIEYSEDGNTWVADEGTYVEGLTFTLYKSVRNVVRDDPSDLIAVTIDVENYFYSSIAHMYRRLTFELKIVVSDGDSITVYPTLTQYGCNGAVVITWDNDNGELLGTAEIKAGKMPVYTGQTPTKESDCEYTYTFSGWTPEIEEALLDTTYTAFYEGEHRTYTVRWINNYEGEEELKRLDGVYCSENPEYDGETPTRPTEAGITYAFSGWGPEEGPITGNTTYVAQYSEALEQYEITFVNWDSSTLASVTVTYNTVPAYPGTTPTKAEDQQNTYLFNGWDHTITAATRNDIYQATFAPVRKKYDITWKNYNGSVLRTDGVFYGETPNYGGTPTGPQGYVFNGWSPTVVAVTGDTTYTATFIEETYTVTFDVHGHGEAPANQYVQYGSLATEPNVPTAVGYIFSGWYKESTYTNAWNFSTDVITENTTLHAKWTEDDPYLIFTSNQNGSTVKLSRKGTSYSTVQYFIPGTSNAWSEASTATTFTINYGEKVYFRGKLSTNCDHYYLPTVTQFGVTGNVSISGKLAYLWDYENPGAALKWACGAHLFNSCTGITNVSQLEFPSTTSNLCYYGMFDRCSNLRLGPTLPAKELNNQCYASMFGRCTSLQEVTCLAETSVAVQYNDPTANWFLDASSSGTFYKKANGISWSRDINGIPPGWTPIDV